MKPKQHPFMLSVSQPTRRSSPNANHRRAGFDRLRLNGIWVACLPAFMIASTAHAKPKPKPGFEAALPLPAPTPKIADGGIFNAAAGYAALTDGHRARMVGDPITIQLVENTTATKSQGSKTAKSGGFGVTPPTTGPLSFIKPTSLNMSGNTSFKGDGSANQQSSLGGELSVTIVAVRPNGTALVRGEKRLLLSQGEEWVQVSGIVRLADLDADNRILSTRVADAHIEYAGNGPTSRAAREGWLSKFFNLISPF